MAGRHHRHALELSALLKGLEPHAASEILHDELNHILTLIKMGSHPTQKAWREQWRDNHLARGQAVLTALIAHMEMSSDASSDLLIQIYQSMAVNLRIIGQKNDAGLLDQLILTANKLAVD
ncbi:hypothetical protein [Sphingorhabdus lutea]|nr:hypothetical protein [Sphingorhabdus lutea]